MIDLGTLVAHILVDSGDSNRQLLQFGNNAGQAGNASDGLTNALGRLAAGLTIGVIIKKAIDGIVACTKAADELQQALNTLQTKTGATNSEMQGFEKSLKNLYANNYGESFEDIAQSMAEVNMQTGLTGAALELTTENAIAMRDTFGFEVNESIRAVDMMMRQFGVTADEAYNLISQGAQTGLDKNGNLLDSVNEYSIHFKQLGFDSEEMFNMFSNGAQMGVFDIDKLGDAVKEFGIRSKDGSNTTIEAYELLGLNAEELQQKFAEGGEEAQNAFEQVANALNDCDNEVIKNTAGVNLFGTMFEDMGAEAVKALTQTQGQITLTADSLEKIKEIKYDSVGQAFAGIGRQLELGIMIPIGEKILPILNDFANWVSNHMSEVETAIKVALTGAAAAFVVFGGPIGLAVTAIAGLATAGVLLYDSLTNKVSPAVDLLSDKVSYAADGTMILEQAISDSTEAAVGAYIDLERGAEESLAKMSTIVSANTEEQIAALSDYSSNVQEKYSQMKDMVISKMEERQSDEMRLLQEGFAQSSTLTDEQEAEIVAKLNNKQWEEKELVSQHYAEINAIVANAQAEKRGLNLEEIQQIQAIQQEQKANAVNVLSDTEMEAKVILERMKSYNETVTTEIASKTIADAEAARIAVVAEAEQKCIEEIALATRMKDELGVISQEEYEQLVADAEKKRLDTISEAEAMKTATVQAMLDQNAELANTVDTSTGEILTKWEVFKNNTAAKWNEIRANMSQTTALIKTSVVKEFSELRTDIENKISNIKEMLTKKWREMVDSVKSFGKDMKQAGNDLIQGLINGITEKVEVAVAKVKNLCQSIVNTAKGVFDEHSPSRVFYEIGDYVTQGLANGIAENGENAVGQMEALAEKILSTGDALSTGIVSKDAETGQLIYDNLYSTVMNRIDLYYQERDKRIALINDGTEENIKAVQQEVKETEKATNLKIKLYQQEYKAKLQLLDDETNEATKALQAELDTIDAAEEQKQRDEAELAHKEKINGLQQKLLVANEEERADIFKEIQKTEADRQKVLDKQALQDKKNGIREQMEQVREEAAEKKKALQQELEAKEYQLQQQRTAEVEHMNVVISLMQAQLDKKKELEKIASEISKKEEQIRTDDFAREKEKQTDKTLTEIQKQEIARKEEKRQQNITELESLKVRQDAEQKAFEQSNTLLWQTVSDFELAQQTMTNAQLEEVNKRQEYSNHELFPAASADTPVSIAKAQTEEQNIIAEEQTEFKKEQWDDQTAYQAQKEQEQTKTFSQESKQQTDTFVANIKKGESEFSLALNRMKIILQEFSASIQAISSQWGRFFYDGITSTEGDIVAYINRMVRKMRESLENASFASRGDFEERSVDGSHRNGLSYVPFDNYNTILHKGEAVLTAAENRNYQSTKTMQGKQVSVQVTQHIYSPTPDARQEQRRAAREFKKMGLEW